MVIMDSKGEICNNQGGDHVVLMAKLLKPESTFSVVYWPTVTAYPYLRGGDTEPTSARKVSLKIHSHGLKITVPVERDNNNS